MRVSIVALLGLSLSALSGCASWWPAAQTEAEPAAVTDPAATGWLSAVPSEGGLPGVLSVPHWPASPTQIRTTSAAIYLGNLDARIAQLQRSTGNEAAIAPALASSLLHRYRILGRLEDAEAAGRLLQRHVASTEVSPPLRIAWAQWLALMHRFAEAEAQLALAGADQEALVRSLREEITLARGRYQQLGPAFHEPAVDAPDDPFALASGAHAALLHGDLDLASRLYFEAQTRYRDVSPYPLAWLHVQQGIALLRHGHCEPAARFFAAARERLPPYYLATEHLAECQLELGRIEQARALYEEVIEQTGDPQFIAALADLEDRDQRPERAALLRLQADEVWEKRLQQHPDAWAQHAAEYFLATDRWDRALQLATRNLALRQDVGSHLLMAEVALAGNDRGTACAQLLAVVQTGLKPPELGELWLRAGCL